VTCMTRTNDGPERSSPVCKNVGVNGFVKTAGVGIEF